MSPPPPLKTKPKRRTAQVTGKPPAARPKGKYVFRLFVAGATDRSRQAVVRVRNLCETELKGRCILEVIDIYQQPGLARDNQIVATPTLIKLRPLPVRRFIGSLTDLTGLVGEIGLLIPGKAVL